MITPRTGRQGGNGGTLKIGAGTNDPWFEPVPDTGCQFNRSKSG